MKFLIVGLGNIGDEYANTRHNIGFILADALAQDMGAKFTVDRLAYRAEARFRGKTIGNTCSSPPHMNLEWARLTVIGWMMKKQI
ncbi:hypothetical protein MASR1M74_18280 [Lentimicrobium sp.]